jgi:hypothetical protein
VVLFRRQFDPPTCDSRYFNKCGDRNARSWLLGDRRGPFWSAPAENTLPMRSILLIDIRQDVLLVAYVLDLAGRISGLNEAAGAADTAGAWSSRQRSLW